MQNKRSSIKEKWDLDNQMLYYVGQKERVMPMILGGVIGDALGVPVEFKERGSFKIVDMVGYGTHQQPLGTWSDDTSLTMCLIESIINEEGEEGLLKRFSDYMKKGYWTPTGETFDIGIATRQAIERYEKGVPASLCGGRDEHDNGNGALMRISPLVPLLSKTFDVDVKLNKIKKICQITHAHPRSILACIVYIQFMIMMYNNNSKIQAYEGTKKFVSRYLKQSEYSEELKHYNRILENCIWDYNMQEIQSDGYVVHTLEAAMWCFFKHNNYKDIVLEAVNLGGDTDTVAFIAGTMAGLYYKMENIPQNWIKSLVAVEKIENICQEYCKFLVAREYGSATI